MKAMAATLFQSQLSACNSKSQYHPPAFANAATTFSELPSYSSAGLPGARFGAAPASLRIPIGRKAIRSLAEPSLPSRPRSDGSSSSVANVPRRSTPLLGGRSGRFTQMEGVGLLQEGANSSRRVLAVKAAPKVVIMVDPVEAKRLAAAEMMAIEARAKIKRQKEIEATNGGWAVLGLTAGVVIDGYTGKSILIQIAGYLDAVTDFLAPLIPS